MDKQSNDAVGNALSSDVFNKKFEEEDSWEENRPQRSSKFPVARRVSAMARKPAGEAKSRRRKPGPDKQWRRGQPRQPGKTDATGSREHGAGGT
jgi:hypothetical protein